MQEFEKGVRIRVAGILRKEGEVLLIAHKKNNKIYWLLPGGGVYFGESLEDALLREFKEELNINVEINTLELVFDSIAPGGGRHILNMCFNANYVDGVFHLADEERLYDYRFFSIDELDEIQMFPPINIDLKNMLLNKNHEIYLGRRWLDQ